MLAVLVVVLATVLIGDERFVAGFFVGGDGKAFLIVHHQQIWRNHNDAWTQLRTRRAFHRFVVIFHGLQLIKNAVFAAAIVVDRHRYFSVDLPNPWALLLGKIAVKGLAQGAHRQIRRRILSARWRWV